MFGRSVVRFCQGSALLLVLFFKIKTVLLEMIALIRVCDVKNILRLQRVDFYHFCHIANDQ